MSDAGANADGSMPPSERAAPVGARLDAARRSRNGEVVAVVGQQVVDVAPADLYIPPDALEVFLEAFEGPLDLLLYLIRRRNLDILQVKVAEITDQYLRYIEMMQALQITLAGEYLAMAATFAEIKSRLLLPRAEDDNDDAPDPRAELLRRLQEYEQFKAAAADLDALPRLERDTFLANAALPPLAQRRAEPPVAMQELMLALADALHRANLHERHAVQMEALSVRERMSSLLATVSASERFVPFSALFAAEEGRRGVVVTFLALLELCREGLVALVQHRAWAPIYVRSAAERDPAWPDQYRQESPPALDGGA